MALMIPFTMHEAISAAAADLPAASAADRFFARPASCRDPDWPFWFVADRAMGGLNVTADIVRRHIDQDHAGGVFGLKITMEPLARIANARRKI